MQPELVPAVNPLGSSSEKGAAESIDAIAANEVPAEAGTCPSVAGGMHLLSEASSTGPLSSPSTETASRTPPVSLSVSSSGQQQAPYPGTVKPPGEERCERAIERLSHIAMLCSPQENHPGVKMALWECLAIQRQALGPDHVDVARGLNGLASACQAQSKFPASELFHVTGSLEDLGAVRVARGQRVWLRVTLRVFSLRNRHSFLCRRPGVCN